MTKNKKNKKDAMIKNQRMGSRQIGAAISRMAVNPFPRLLRTTMTWAPPALNYAPASSNFVMQFNLNGITACQSTSVFSTTQPLYFDDICSNTGPYNTYVVHGWKMRLDVLNLTIGSPTSSSSAVELLVQQGYETLSDGDTNAELQAAPNVERYLLSAAGCGGELDRQLVTIQGRTRDFIGDVNFDSSNEGNYTGNPSVTLRLNIGARSLDSSYVTLGLQMQLQYDVEFSILDAVAS